VRPARLNNPDDRTVSQIEIVAPRVQFLGRTINVTDEGAAYLGSDRPDTPSAMDDEDIPF
jgi:hypothetical protein